MSQASGRVTIKLGTEQLQSKSGASLQLGGIDREFDMTDQLQSYYKEKGVPSQIKATLVHMTETDLIALRKRKDFQAQFETDTGHVYTISNAAVATLGDLSNGEVEVTIGGDPASE